MPSRIVLFVTIAVLVGWSAGCSDDLGVVPKQGYNTSKVNYTRKPNPTATVVELPFINPTVDPDAMLPLAEPHIWPKSKLLAFVGEIQRFDDQQEAVLVELKIAQLSPDGSAGESIERRLSAKRKEGDDHLTYRIEQRAPSKAGRYQVTVSTTGPSLATFDLDPFVMGEVEVQ